MKQEIFTREDLELAFSAGYDFAEDSFNNPDNHEYVNERVALKQVNDVIQSSSNCNIPHVSASTVKSLHTALKNLLQATDDEGWNNEGEDWEEQLEARMILAQTPKEYLR